MAEPILTVEELDTYWPTDTTSEPDYADRMTRIDDSRRELRNHRTRVKTMEDALDAYDGLVADAYKIRALGMDGQTFCCNLSLFRKYFASIPGYPATGTSKTPFFHLVPTSRA